MSAMTDDGSGVIEREIEGLVTIHRRKDKKRTEEDLLREYGVGPTVEAVRGIDECSRVALQMPDSLLGDASWVQSALRTRCPDVMFVILADTLFAPCCVDEVTAEHINAQLIVKYGHSCFTATSRIPVHYVPYHLYKPDDDEPTENSAEVVVDPYFPPVSRPIRESPFIVSGVEIPLGCRSLHVREGDRGVLQQAVLWEEWQSITEGGGVLTVGGSLVDEVDAVRRDVRKRLRQRMFLTEKVKDVEVVAIVVASLAIEGYTGVVEHLKKIISDSGKQYIVVYVGKPNVPKLTNYEEVDLYCIVACPQSTWFDAKEYPKPVVTPLEISLALAEPLSDSENTLLEPYYYSLELFAATQYFQNSASAQPPDISLVTGLLRTSHIPEDEQSEPEDADSDLATHTTTTGQVITYSQKQLVAFQESPIVSRLHQRNYQGLELDSETPVQDEILPGLVGIASGYKSEPKVG
eukprot:TRINITY_DN15790_c0_g1_i2.p1 TRINITY_DN15790_c0_g1~~TRINITY_DN15790_c0_g1_i2.p1  ORF type:complete len:481 (+),score=82.41 TRINITY_DN15790_c0_g1_i2:54-1445(+)